MALYFFVLMPWPLGVNGEGALPCTCFWTDHPFPSPQLKADVVPKTAGKAKMETKPGKAGGLGVELGLRL